MKKKIGSSLLILILAISGLTACGSNGTLVNQQTQAANENVETIVASDIIDPNNQFSERDLESGYDENSSIKIQLNGKSSETNSEAVKIQGGTITIQDEGTYVFSGSLDDGQIIVEAEKTDKVQLVLLNANIKSETAAPIYVKQADKVFITLAADSQNTLINGGEFIQSDDNTVDGVIYSQDDLTLNGKGTLSIESPIGHGIVSKDDLVIGSGNYNIQAKKDAINGKDSVRIAQGTFKLVAETDGIQSKNNDDASKGYIYIADGIFEIQSGTDGLDAGYGILITDGKFKITAEDDGIHSDGQLKISDGEIDINKSYEGLEGQNIIIDQGQITLFATDDGINATSGTENSGQNEFAADENVWIQINGGTIKVNSEGDGIDSNGNLYVTGGEIYVSGPTNNGNGALDYNGKATITGGMVIATGASGMAQNFGEESTQGTILYNIDSMTHEMIKLVDNDGNVLIEYAPDKEYNSVVISLPSIKEEARYQLLIGTASYKIQMTQLVYGESRGMGGGQPPMNDRSTHPSDDKMRPEPPQNSNISN